jgi:hypothetical protein
MNQQLPTESSLLFNPKTRQTSKKFTVFSQALPCELLDVLPCKRHGLNTLHISKRLARE